MSSQQFWKLIVKKLTGVVIHVHLANPLVATVLDLKKLIQQQDAQIQPHLQCLVLQRPSNRVKLQDDSAKLTNVGVQDGSCISLIMLPPFELYVQGTDQTMHTVVVPSREPENYKISLLRKLVEAKVGHNLDDYMLQLQKTPLEEARHGKTLTLRDYRIKNGNTLFLLKVEIILNINNPEVDDCYFVDCTGSMGSYIEAVKNNVQSLRDHLATEYKGCDLRFAFIRYTDYDQPESTRTTWINFTREQEAQEQAQEAKQRAVARETAAEVRVQEAEQQAVARETAAEVRVQEAQEQAQEAEQRAVARETAAEVRVQKAQEQAQEAEQRAVARERAAEVRVQEAQEQAQEAEKRAVARETAAEVRVQEAQEQAQEAEQRAVAREMAVEIRVQEAQDQLEREAKVKVQEAQEQAGQEEQRAIALVKKNAELERRLHEMEERVSESKRRTNVIELEDNPSSDSDKLSSGDLHTVLNLTWDARSKWYNIGLNVGIPVGTLDAVRRNHRDICEDCYRTVLGEWLRDHPSPTWSALEDALRAPSVKMNHIAEQLPNSSKTFESSSPGEGEESQSSNTTGTRPCCDIL